MATGACGINCDVCQLNFLGRCSSCGAGRSDLAAAKSAAQERILGQPCPILACARMNHLDYCLRDCAAFPCDNFSAGGYPYGSGFLQMQQRRRQEGPPAVDPSGRPITIDAEKWEALAKRDAVQLANFTMMTIDRQTGFLRFRFLARDILVDTRQRCLMEKKEMDWIRIDRVLLELTVIDYLTRVTCLHPMGRELVGTDDLPEAHYFTGHGRLDKDALLARFGDDPEGFAAAGRRLAGRPETMADVSFRLAPLPRIPVYYLLWLGAETFSPHLSILFDRSVGDALTPAAIWSLVTLCNYYLITGMPGGDAAA